MNKIFALGGAAALAASLLSAVPVHAQDAPDGNSGRTYNGQRRDRANDPDADQRSGRSRNRDGQTTDDRNRGGSADGARGGDPRSGGNRGGDSQREDQDNRSQRSGGRYNGGDARQDRSGDRSYGGNYSGRGGEREYDGRGGRSDYGGSRGDYGRGGDYGYDRGSGYGSRGTHNRQWMMERMRREDQRWRAEHPHASNWERARWRRSLRDKYGFDLYSGYNSGWSGR